MKLITSHKITKYIINIMNTEGVSKVKLTADKISFKKEGFLEERKHNFSAEEFQEYIAEYLDFDFNKIEMPLTNRTFDINDKEFLYFCFLDSYICPDNERQLIVTKRAKGKRMIY